MEVLLGRGAQRGPDLHPTDSLGDDDVGAVLVELPALLVRLGHDR